jgi:epoxyqueuosine reductase
MLTSDEVKRRARALGFTHVGVARAGGLEKESALFDVWCRHGYDATMGWMRKRSEERRDVRLILQEARSVIVVALNYAAPPEYQSGARDVKISQYARGDDYHEVIGKRLEELMKWIRAADPGAEGRFYVDTGPILEKAWAVRAGIGWQGKHTNVITRDQGSWVFLGVLLTTLDLVPDTPAIDQCGSCTRCIDACPTQAIVAPYVLDARRCISYLTIEHKGDIPEELADGCGEWVFGCDVCQDVCPWNIKFARPSQDPAWASGTGIEREAPDALLAMTREDFVTRFRRSAVRRARWEGFVRNVRNALRNLALKRKTPDPLS